MSDKGQYSGFLKRDGAGYAGEIRDSWGWRIALAARVVEKDGEKQFALSGTLGEPPEALRIPALDDEPAPGAPVIADPEPRLL